MSSDSGFVWSLCDACAVAWRLLGYQHAQEQYDDVPVDHELPNYCERCEEGCWTPMELDALLWDAARDVANAREMLYDLVELRLAQTWSFTRRPTARALARRRARLAAVKARRGYVYRAAEG